MHKTLKVTLILVSGVQQACVLLCSGSSSLFQVLAKIHPLPNEVPGLPKYSKNPHISVHSTDEYSMQPAFPGSYCMKHHIHVCFFRLLGAKEVVSSKSGASLTCCPTVAITVCLEGFFVTHGKNHATGKEEVAVIHL